MVFQTIHLPEAHDVDIDVFVVELVTVNRLIADLDVLNLRTVKNFYCLRHSSTQP